jgi:hypothetical protein
MKYSGFYMANGVGKKGAKENTLKMFNEELEGKMKEMYGENTFEVFDIVRSPENEIYDDENGQCFDVHFFLDIPKYDFKEDSHEFYLLEMIMCTGLGTVSEEDYERDRVK